MFTALAGLMFPISADNRSRPQLRQVLGDLRDIRGALAGVQDYGRRAGRSMRDVGTVLSATVTAPIAGFGIGVLRTAGDFEEAMLRTGAISRATGEDLDRLTALAREMGGTTRFSAVQAAEGLGFLAMAGLSVDEQIGALPGVLQLATASGMELATAADIATNVLSNFGMGVDQMGRVNDVLATTATSTNTTVEQMGQAMMETGAIATMAGLEFEEVAAALGLMANAGFRAGRGGTALRGGLARLLNPVGEAATAIEAMGLETLDAAGNLRPLVDILGDVAPHADDAGLMLQLFGQEAGPGMAALLAEGPEALRELTQSLQDSGGAAEEMAGRMDQGLNAALRSLGSAFGDLQIAIGESGLLDDVTALIERFTGFVRSVSETHPELVRIGTGVALVAAAIGPLLMVLGAMTIGLSALASPLGLIVFALGAIGGAAAYVAANWDDLSERFPILRRAAEFGQELAQAWSDLPAIRWALLIPALRWARFIPGLRWASYIPTISWTVAAGALRWGALIGRLSWAALGVIGPIGWVALAGSLIWGTLIEGLEWDGWIPRIEWRDWVADIDWLSFIPDLDWAALGVIGPIGWVALAGSLIWGTLIDIVEWGGWIPRIEWADWITRIDWRDWIPEINWRELLNPGRAALEAEAARQAGAAVGGALGAGVTLGIEGSRDGAGQATSDLIDFLTRTAEDTAQIRSPSRVWMGIGEDLVNGVALGVRNTTGEAAGAVGDLVEGMNDAAARAPSVVQSLGSMWGSTFSSIVRGAENARDALGQLFDRMSDMVLSNAFNQLFNGLFGGGGGVLNFLFGGPQPFAQGAAFQGGAVVPFARGGVVTGPTAFPMSMGRTGLMGEAGPEAIMPLARMSGGGLGIRADLSAPAPAAAAKPAPVYISVQVDGASGDDHIRDLVRQGVTQGLELYDSALPDRVAQIDADPLARF